jgi:alpha-beta hydrolase superfamily lysophospholipase
MAKSPQKLLVLVPALDPDCKLWQPLRKRLAEEPGFGPEDARWLDFDHQTHHFSLGSLEAVADSLKSRIDAEWERSGGYQEVILIGHSLGGLIVRQAFLLAAGEIPGGEASPWVRHVSRMVLLASLNRGIDVQRRIDHRVMTRLVLLMHRLFPFLPYLRVLDAIKGSAFLTNLRINWIRYFYRSDQQRSAPPLVVQVLGDKDQLVHKEDSKDVLAFANGHYLTVPEANHKELYRIDLAPDPELRYAVIRKAFVGEFANAARERDCAPEIKRVVFLLHGIRASNVDKWIEGLRKLIEDRDPHTRTRRPTYGYFTALRFALPSVRRRNVAILQDAYTEALADFPDAEFNIIAHSNGTYMLGQALLAIPGMRFTNAALVGSVLPEDFWQRFTRLRDQVKNIRNDRANRDWPVALLCSALRGLRMRDVGPAGFSGFLGESALEVAYYRGGHGAALEPGNWNRLVTFVFGLGLEKPENLVDEPGFYRQLSNLMPYLTPLAVLVVVAGGIFWTFQDAVFHLERAILAAVILLVLYVALDVA